MITVGLNPSRLEFPISDPFLRFPEARALSGETLSGADRGAYARAMNDYFRIAPYSAWFRPSFEEVLRGMGASFYGDATSTAVHTDLFSPIATDPTWSRLGSAREALRADGVGLWHALVEALEPDVIVASVARGYLDFIEFPWTGPWREIHVVERANPYVVSARGLTVTTGRETTLVFGPAAQKPFGKIGSAEKRRVGATVRALIRADSGPQIGKSFDVWVTDPSTGKLALVTTMPLMEVFLEGRDLRTWYLGHKAQQRRAQSGHDVAALPQALERAIRERLGLGPEPPDEQWLPLDESPWR